jgi:hypothetical protein
LYEWTFPNGEVIHHFHFKVIKLWEIPAMMLKQTGLVGIYPLMVLTKDGQRPEVVEEVITGLQQQEGESAKELISLTYIFAALAFEKQDDLAWLKRRIHKMQDFLEESWLFQEIMQKGFDKGIEKEREEELRRQRQLLMTIFQMHFPNITDLAQKQADAIKEPDVLQSLIFKVLAAETEEEANRAIMNQ